MKHNEAVGGLIIAASNMEHSKKRGSKQRLVKIMGTSLAKLTRDKKIALNSLNIQNMSTPALVAMTKKIQEANK